MTLDTSNVLIASNGGFYIDLTNVAAAPTNTSTALDALLLDMGYSDEEGWSIELPEDADPIIIKGWQGNATVRTIRYASDDSPLLTTTFIETKPQVAKVVFGGTLTQTVAHGSLPFDATAVRPYFKLVVQVIDGAEIARYYAPKAIVTSVGEMQRTSTGASGYPVTIACDRDSTLGYNFIQIDTKLKTPA